MTIFVGFYIKVTSRRHPIIRGCEFQSTVASEELHEHCQDIHHWKSHPCLEDNCKFIAYSSAALKQHSRFHTRKSSKHYDFRCTRAQCHTGFHRRLLLKEHENIHDNIQFECVFCQGIIIWFYWLYFNLIPMTYILSKYYKTCKTRYD